MLLLATDQSPAMDGKEKGKPECQHGKEGKNTLGRVSCIYKN